MRISSRFTFPSLRILVAVFATGLRAAELATAEQAKSAEIKAWTADPAIVTAAVAHNAQMPADQAGMPRDNWKTPSLLDSFRRFAKNGATNGLATSPSPVGGLQTGSPGATFTFPPARQDSMRPSAASADHHTS